jgi:hypothetical protein
VKDPKLPVRGLRSDQIRKLREKARTLRSLLNRYAKIDSDVENILSLMTGILDEIEQGKVVPPKRDEFRWYFFNTESPLFMKYSDLSQAEAEYAEVLEGWDFKMLR